MEQLRGTVPPPSGDSIASKERDTLRQKRRPGLVTLIALFQFSKAGFLLVVIALVLVHPEMQRGSLPFWGLVYVASNGGGRPGLVTLLVGIYSAIVGWGLWVLKPWARNILMVTSGLTTLRWIRYLSINAIIGDTELGRHVRTLKPGFEQQSVYLLVLLDALVFCCLAFYPDVAEAFGKKD